MGLGHRKSKRFQVVYCGNAHAVSTVCDIKDLDAMFFRRGDEFKRTGNWSSFFFMCPGIPILQVEGGSLDDIPRIKRRIIEHGFINIQDDGRLFFLELSEFQIFLADVNQDGEVDILDVVSLVSIILES